MNVRSVFLAKISLGAALLMFPFSGHAATFQQYFAVLDAGNELDGGHSGAVGTAMVMLGPKAGQVCFAILVRDLDTPILAHIHAGAAGIDGGIVVTLTPPASGNPGQSSGCLTGVTTATINAIKANPTKFYINVHSNSNQGGALRGQLF